MFFDGGYTYSNFLMNMLGVFAFVVWFWLLVIIYGESLDTRSKGRPGNVAFTSCRGNLTRLSVKRERPQDQLCSGAVFIAEGGPTQSQPLQRDAGPPLHATCRQLSHHSSGERFSDIAPLACANISHRAYAHSSACYRYSSAQVS